MHLYRKMRASKLEQLANLHQGLNEGRRKNRLVQWWMNKNRIKYLEHDIRTLQVSLATMRSLYYAPERRLVRNLKGYL